MGKNDDEVQLLPLNGSSKKNYVSGTDFDLFLKSVVIKIKIDENTHSYIATFVLPHSIDKKCEQFQRCICAASTFFNSILNSTCLCLFDCLRTRSMRIKLPS